MPEYHFGLLPHDSAETRFETIEAVDDEQARSLAEIRLLMTPGMAGVSVVCSGVELVRLSQTASPPSGSTEGMAGSRPNASPDAREGLPKA